MINYKYFKNLEKIIKSYEKIITNIKICHHLK